MIVYIATSAFCQKYDLNSQPVYQFYESVILKLLYAFCW